jgi:hypothetical protein
MSKKKIKRIKISYADVNDGEILIECLDRKTIKEYGFGTFFLDLKKEEIDITDEAKEILKECINREYSSIGDLFGFSVGYHEKNKYNPEFNGCHCSYACLENEILVPPEDITVDYEAYRRLFDE